MFELEDKERSLVRYIPEAGETRVAVPEGVTYIRGGAFQDCPELEIIQFSSTVTGVDAGAFRNCPALTGLFLNDGLSTFGWADRSPIQNCPKLKELEFPASIMKGNLKGSCVETVSFREGLKRVPEHFFWENDNLKSVYLPDSAEEILGGAFGGCTGLTHVRMGGVKKLGIMAFFDCKSLRDFRIPNTVEEIGYSCFQGSGITRAEIPVGIRKISESAFAGCENLHGVVIPNTVEEIHKKAFWGTNLMSVRIPGSVQVVGEGAFHACDSLTEVVICSEHTRFVRNVWDMFPEHVRLIGESHKIPGEKRVGKMVGIFGTFFACLVVYPVTAVVAAALAYLLLGQKYPRDRFLTFKEHWALIYEKEFIRPWYERVPVLGGELPWFLKEGGV